MAAAARPTARPTARSTAGEQQQRIAAAAVAGFARAGLHATPVAEIARAAGVSTAYVFSLFDGKTGLFVSAVDRCYTLVAQTLVDAGEATGSGDPDTVLAAMTGAYVELIADRDLIRFQVHAQSACDDPAVREAVQRGMAQVVEAVGRVSGAEPDAVQRFVAYGQLCHLIVQAGLDSVDREWAHVLTDGMLHP